MMKKIFINTAILTAVMLSGASCEKPEFDPVDKGKGETVDITLRSAQSKTMLDNDCSVFWEENDGLIINDRHYIVDVNTNDRTMATVNDVEASADGYFAMYPFGYADSSGDELYVCLNSWQNYRENGFGKEANPMIAYSATTEMFFHNVASVIKIGVYGEGHTVKTLTVSGNNGEYMSGDMFFDKDDVRNGNFADYRFEAARYEAYDHVQVEWPYYDDEGNRVETPGLVLGAEPEYIYVVIPARTYTKGFTVKMVDTEGNVCIKRTDKSFEAVRSDIKTMAAFEFVPLETPLTVETVSTTATAVKIKAKGLPGEKALFCIVAKDYWDRIIEIWKEDGDYTSDEELAEEILFDVDISEMAEIAADGTVSVTMDMCLNHDEYSCLFADTEYVLLSAYGIDQYTPMGHPSVNSFKTSVSTGAKPSLSLTRIASDNLDSWNDVTVHIDTDAKNVFFYFGTLDEIERDKAELRISEDRDLVSRWGTYLWEKYKDYGEFEEYWSEGNIIDYNNYVNQDYRCMVLAVSEEGAETFKSLDYRISFLPDATWTQVSDKALFDCGVFKSVTYRNEDMQQTFYCDNFFIRDLVVEKMLGADVFRVKNLFSCAKSHALEKMGYSDKDGDFYTYIDARVPDAVQLYKHANEMGLTFMGHNYLYYGGDRYEYDYDSDGIVDNSYGSYDKDNAMISLNGQFGLNSYRNSGNEEIYGWSNPSVLYLDPEKAGMNLEDFVMDDNKTEW